jgi:hypothetical protein
MTLIVGFHLGSYALIGADTRVCYYPNDQLCFRDDERKIRCIEMGLITGAGLVDMLDPVKERLDSADMIHTDTIIEAAKAQREIVLQRPWATHPRVAQSIQQIAWMFTYVTADNPSQPTPESVKLRLAFTVPSEGYKLVLVPPNAIWLLPPTGTTEQQFGDWTKLCQDNVQALTKGDDFGENVAHHAATIAALMKTVSAVNEGVAETFQLGLHVFPTPRFVSTIIGPDCEFAWESGDSAE